MLPSFPYSQSQGAPLLCSTHKSLPFRLKKMALYLKVRQMLSQNGYQEPDMYPTQQLYLESQTFLQTQWQQTLLGVYLQQMTFVLYKYSGPN